MVSVALAGFAGAALAYMVIEAVGLLGALRNKPEPNTSVGAVELGYFWFSVVPYGAVAAAVNHRRLPGRAWQLVGLAAATAGTVLFETWDGVVNG